MAFDLSKIVFKTDSKKKTRMYCNNESCDEKALGTTANLSVTHDVVLKHSRDFHGDPYPFD